MVLNLFIYLFLFITQALTRLTLAQEKKNRHWFGSVHNK